MERFDTFEIIYEIYERYDITQLQKLSEKPL